MTSFIAALGMVLAGADVPIRLVLPADVDPTKCEMHYFLVGPFGGYPNELTFDLDPW